MTKSVLYKPTITVALIFISLVIIGCNPYKQETELIKAYAQRIDESTWSDLNFKMIEIEYMNQITALDSLNILEVQIRQSAQSTNDFLSEMINSYERSVNSLKMWIAQEPSTPWNESIVREFHEDLIQLQASGSLSGLPESFKVFGDAFAQTSYRSQLFGYLKAREEAGDLSGLPSTLQEFQDAFWPEEPPIGPVNFDGLECLVVDYYANLQEKLSNADIYYVLELEERIRICETIIDSNNDFLESGDIQYVDFLTGRLNNRLESLKHYQAKPDSILGHIFKCIYEVDDPTLGVRNTVTTHFLLNSDRTKVLMRLNNGVF